MTLGICTDCQFSHTAKVQVGILYYIITFMMHHISNAVMSEINSQRQPVGLGTSAEMPKKDSLVTQIRARLFGHLRTPESLQPPLPGIFLTEGGRKRERSGSSEEEEEGEVRSRMDAGGKKGKGEHAAVPCHNVRRCGQV